MIKKYQEYVDEMIECEKRKNQIRADGEKSLIEDLKEKLSKYLKSTKGEVLSGHHSRYENEAIIEDIFLIDEDFGFIVSSDFIGSYNAFYASRFRGLIRPVYKTTKGWVISPGSEIFTFYTNDTNDVDAQIEEYIKRIQKKNVTRKREKEKRELKRAVNKYNL